MGPGHQAAEQAPERGARAALPRAAPVRLARCGVVAALALAAPAGAVDAPSGLILFQRNSSIVVVPAAGGVERNLSGNAGPNGGAAWSPDGHAVAFGSGRDGRHAAVYLVAPDSSGLHRISPAPFSGRLEAWSPDGRTILVEPNAGVSDREIHALDVASGTERTLARAATQPTWSPDGRRIAFTSTRHRGSWIYVMNANGSGQRAISTGANDYAPRWSPDGKRIAYLSGVGGLSLVAVDPGGRNLRVLASGNVDAAVWSPDSSQVAFRCGLQICVVGADGGPAQELARGDDPTWSPDGRWIAFVRGAQIWVMAADGSAQRRVTRDHASDALPSWQPA